MISSSDYGIPPHGVVYGDGEIGAPGDGDGEGEINYDEALEMALDGGGSDDGCGVEGGEGTDSDSSLDLHTPLP
jgi:hypothetical protein